MIDVIIPAYNAHDTIDQTLASIAFQNIAKDLNVYIVNDCSKENYSEYVDFYSKFMNVKELTLEKNSGPGQARQYGIDNSNSDYLIFIDSDDVFADTNAINSIYQTLLHSNADIAVSTFLEELENIFIPNTIQYVWMHGKMYRRSYLNNNNIRFNETYVNEDCGFNQLCYMCGANYIELSKTTYIWRNNNGSLTRTRTIEANTRYLKMFIHNMLWSIEEALKRDCNKERVSEIIYGTIVASYHYYLQNQELFHKEEMLDKLIPLIEYHHKYPITDQQRLVIIKNQINSESSGPDLLKVYNPSITLNEFIKMLEKKVGV